MNRFRGRMEDNRPKCKWNGHGGVYEACAEHKQFIVEVRKYDESAEISRQQMRYYHAMPVRLYSKDSGSSLWETDQILKRECGADMFMLDWTEEEHRHGRTMFMCMDSNCRLMMLAPGRGESGYVCRSCGQGNLKPFFMLSKTELKVNQFNDYLENVWTFLESVNCHCPKPDKNWRINRKKKRGSNDLQ